MTAAQIDQPLTVNPRLEERIRERAYELYLQRADGSSNELDDWLEAERQILAGVEIEQQPRSMWAQA